ncbi:hypothetical protein [Micromonospora sp. CV4]|uniref:hypothetical protein n=1 Tax=Micromonospora sp. CV4 TaxID=2478711 RepID=UPI000EF5032F|nr:hypothetical protein [Micromonospora sp. CV4]RLP92290.1 hypothetical protein EAD98_22035 [Micromonospora sp. CV4]
MGDALILLMFAACLAAVLGTLLWLGARARRRGVGGEVMGPFEEMWHPAAHRLRAEIRVQEARVVPMPPQGGRRHGRCGDTAERTAERVGPQDGFGPQT